MVESSGSFTELTRGEFRRRFRAGLIAAWMIPPITALLGMTFLGFWTLEEAGLSLIRFAGVYVIAFTLIAYFVFKYLVIEPVLALGDRQPALVPAHTKRLKAFPWVFWGLLGLYCSFGPAVVLLSNAVFQGTEYTLGEYAFSAFGVIPSLLISAFPLFFYLTDLLGRFLAPRGQMVMVAPLWLKVAVLGLFTPVMIDSILLTYYYDRTGFLSIETIVLWFVLILIAGAGTWVALRSFHQGMGALKQPLGDVVEAGIPTYPVPRSLDEFGLLARGWADLLKSRDRAERKFNERDRQVQDIIDNTDAVVYVKDSAGRYLMVNRRFERLFGFSNDVVLGKTDHDIFAKEFADVFRHNDLQVIRNDAPLEVREIAPHTNGEHTYLSQKFPLYDADRVLYGVGCVSSDITEHLRADEKLRQSEARLSGIIQVANDAIITVDDSQKIILFNQGAEQTFGYTQDEVKGRPLDILLPERLRHKHRENIKLFAEDTVSARRMIERSLPLLGRRKCGEEFPLEASISRLDLGGEKLFTVALRDITERKRAEAALEEVQDRHKEAQRLARLGHWDLDLVNNKLEWSDEIYRIFEVDAGNFGASYDAFLEFVHPDDRAIVDKAYADSVKNRTPYSIAHRLQMEDGRIKHVSEQCVTYYGDEGTPLRSIGTVQDITGRWLAEEELRVHREHLEDLVEKRTAELAIAYEKLKELDQLKSMFIASMSHELRTPLNSIIGFTGIILQGMVGEITATQKEHLGRVHRASKHLLELIGDVIDISKIEAEKIEAFPTEFELDELIDEVTGSVQPLLQERQLELAVSVPQGIRLRTDRKRLLQCVLNYLSNAVKFTESGKISITAREIGGRIEIAVSDTGIGILEDDLPKLFQPFARLDSPLKIKTQGTGLGLYLTRKLVTELLGGTVDVKSQPQKGSTFSLEVPQYIREQQTSARVSCKAVCNEDSTGN